MYVRPKLTFHILAAAVFNKFHKGDTPEKKRLYVGIFPILKGGGLTQTHFFCLFAKFFLHAKIILRFYNRGGGVISDQFGSLDID